MSNQGNDVSVWSKEYPLQEGVKDKRSLAADLGMIRLHLDPFFGSDPLPNITRRRLVEYINVREKERRSGTASRRKSRSRAVLYPTS